MASMSPGLICACVWCSAAYIVALLHDGFKLGMQERRLRFSNYVQDPQGNLMDVDWTLGEPALRCAVLCCAAPHCALLCPMCCAVLCPVVPC